MSGVLQVLFPRRAHSFISSQLLVKDKHQVLVKGFGFKDIYSCPIETIIGLIDKGQFQYLTKLKGPQEGTYLYTTKFI